MSRIASFLHFKLDNSRIQPTLSKLLSELFPGSFELLVGRIVVRLFHLLGSRQQQIEHSFFGVLFRFFGNLGDLLFAYEVNADLDQIADHRLDITPYVSNLSEFRGLDFQKRRIRKPSQSSSNLRLSNSSRADHYYVFWNDVLSEFCRELLPSDSVAKRDSNCAFGGMLADDVLVQFGDNLTRGHFVEP